MALQLCLQRIVGSPAGRSLLQELGQLLPLPPHPLLHWLQARPCLLQTGYLPVQLWQAARLPAGTTLSMSMESADWL